MFYLITVFCLSCTFGLGVTCVILQLILDDASLFLMSLLFYVRISSTYNSSLP